MADLSYTLPGVAAWVTVSPMRHWVDPWSALPLHGALCTVAGVPHAALGAATPPQFVIQGHAAQPEQTYHGAQRLPPVLIHILCQTIAERLSGLDAPVELWGAVRRLRVEALGPVAVSAEGPARVRLCSLSPLILRQTGASAEVRNLLPVHVLAGLRSLRRKLVHLSPAPDEPEHLHLDLRSRHRPFSTGWSDRVRGGCEWEAEGPVDALALLWLRVGEVLGVGTYVSRGFGRYSVEVLP